MPKRPPRTIPAPVVLAAAAFVAILPMLIRGPSCGHDFDFHLLSWLEAANQFAHFGYPHWAYTPAFNAGEPRFLFYPPLSWALGAILGLILPWNLVPAAFTWIALTLSGVTMHRLARRFATPGAALLAATLYLANPYMLFTAYERTAYGELLAAAWLPLLFAAALAERVRILPIAAAIALLWLTNAPAGVMACYVLAFLTVVRLCANSRHSERSEESQYFVFRSSNLRLALTTASGTALGLALDAFYIVPAAYEQRFVQVNMAVIPGMRPQEHFLFHHMAGHTFDDIFHDQVVRTASIVALTLLAAIFVALLAARRPRSSLPSSRPGSPANRFCSMGWLFPLPSLTLLTLLIAFLLTPPSLFLWNHIPKLAFLQFPWRLSALLGVILALTAAIALSRLKASLALALSPVPLALILIFPAWHLFQQRCYPEDTIPAQVALFHSNLGTDATDEYTPIGASGDALRPQDPPYWLIPATPQANPNAPAPPHSQPSPTPSHLSLNLPAPEFLVLNLRQYPTWRITLNGAPIAPIPRKRLDGLTTVLLPAGSDTIDLRQTLTSDQEIGLAISGLACLIAVGATRKSFAS